MKKSAALRSAMALVCVTLFAGLGAPSLANGKKKPPDKKIVLQACAKKKPPVTFDHPAHVKMMKKNKQDCVICHHLVEKKPPDKNSCSECHQKKQGKIGTCFDRSKKQNPFHIRCVGCHKKSVTSPRNKPPTKCAGCHHRTS